MAHPRQVIDGFLDTGWYDEWQDMEQDAAHQQKRSQANEQRFARVKASNMTDHLYWDTRRLEAVAYDYREIMTRIARGQRVDRQRVGTIHDVFTLALGVVRHDNDVLDAAVATGIVAGFVAFPFAVFQWRARRLQELLKVLEKELIKAKRERNEAWVQGAINGALTVVTVAMPQLGLLARGGILVGQWFLDDALGPDTSTRATVGSKTSITVAQYGDAVDGIEKVGRQHRSVARRAGKVATVTGFVFDANEVLVGYRNVDQVRRIMNQAKKAYEDLLTEINRHRATLEKFRKDYARWQVAIRSVRRNATEIRYALMDEMKRTGYQPRA